MEGEALAVVQGKPTVDQLQGEGHLLQVRHGACARPVPQGPDAMSRMLKNRQEAEYGELAGIMSNMSTKKLRWDVLQKILSPPSEEEGGDILEWPV